MNGDGFSHLEFQRLFIGASALYNQVIYRKTQKYCEKLYWTLQFCIVRMNVT